MNAAREEFGENRLAEFAQRQATLHPQDCIKALRLTINDFAGEQGIRDDVTIMVGKVER